MKILEIMERANTRDTNLVIAYIKDAILEIQSNNELDTEVINKILFENTRDYTTSRYDCIKKCWYIRY